MDKFKVSIVVPVYKEENMISLFLERTESVAEKRKNGIMRLFFVWILLLIIRMALLKKK